MEEGRQIEAGNAAEASDKVVRLPRDWLGPREHLVPFGAALPPTVDSEPAGTAPSADDFWGERSADVHDAVQASEPQPAAGTPRPKSRLPRRPLVAAGLVAAAAATAFVLLTTGDSPSHANGGARLNIAALLRKGSSRIAPPRIVARAGAPRIVKHVRHRVPHHAAASAHAHRRMSSPAASTFVARVTTTHTSHPVASTPAPRVNWTPPPAAPSGASVSPTGQSGALGPVHSPNG